jgi:capsular exopolysaccharide synthesis family protein
LATIQRQKWSVLRIALVVTALAAAYSFTRTPSYDSTAEVLVRPTLTSPLTTVSHNVLSLQTEARLATSTAVASLARAQLGSSASAAQLLQHVSVTVPADTEILQITYTDTDPARAQRGAEAFARAYLDFKSEQASSVVDQYKTNLEGRIGVLDGQILKQNRTIAKLVPNSQGWLDALRELDLLQANKISLQDELATATTLSVNPGQTIQSAQLPRAPGSPRHGFDVVMGLLLGLACGIVAASARERYRDAIIDGDVFEQSLGAPVLGIIPRLRASMRNPAQLVTLTEPRSGAAEAYRTLRTNLLAASHRHSTKTILVTSAQMGEGKTTTAANLAVCLALLGKEVVILSADLRRPRIHALFGMQNDQGLSQVLTGELSLADSLRDSAIPHLRVLASGSVSTLLEPAELLQSDRMIEVLAYCEEADFVIIDGPPVRGVADSLGLAGTVDGVIVVADARKGTRASVTAVAYQLEQVGGRVLGGVLNGFEPVRTEDRYTSYVDRRGIVSRMLMSVSGGGDSDGQFSLPDGQLSLPADPRPDLEAASYVNDRLATRSGRPAPPRIEPSETTRPRSRVDRAGNGRPPADSNESSSPGADLGSTS